MKRWKIVFDDMPKVVAAALGPKVPTLQYGITFSAPTREDALRIATEAAEGTNSIGDWHLEEVTPEEPLGRYAGQIDELDRLQN